jgi:hypothetical protein
MSSSFDKEKLRQVWLDRQSLATTLLTLFRDTYGQPDEKKDNTIQALDWDPETIVSEIQEDFHITLPQINIDKLMMAILVVTTDRFFQVLDDFIKVCNVFSGGHFDPNEFDPADAVECAWGITEAMLLWPPEDKEELIFSKEICAYVGKVIDDEGLVNPPDILKIGLSETHHKDPGAAFGDDPELSSSVRRVQQEKSDDVRTSVQKRLLLLISQLKDLPLVHGNTEGLIDKMLKILPKAT